MSLYSCLSYPACKSHLFCAKLYCHLWLVWLNHSFSTEHKLCILIFSRVLCETFLILRRIQREAIINLHRSLYKVPVIKTLIFFSKDFSKDPQIPNFMKICSMRTDRHSKKNSARSDHKFTQVFFKVPVIQT
jgi:hypothetical protein